MIKKILWLTFVLVILEVIFCLGSCSAIAEKETKTSQLMEKVNQLKIENQILEQKTAQLSSLKRISQEAEKLNLSQISRKVDLKSESFFAMR